MRVGVRRRLTLGRRCVYVCVCVCVCVFVCVFVKEFFPHLIHSLSGVYAHLHVRMDECTMPRAHTRTRLKHH